VHVAFFNRSFYPDTTATGQLLTDLCEDLVREYGCRVSVVAGPPLLPAHNGNGTSKTARPWALVRRESVRGVEIFRVSGTRFAKERFAGRAANYMSYFFSALYAGMRLDRPDVVVALTDPPIIGLAALASGKRFKAPLVMAFKDLFPEVTALLPDFKSETINNALQAINKYLIRRSARTLALGETMRRRLIDDKGAPPERTEIIPDWADTEAIRPGAKRNPFAERHGLANRFVVMHSGNIGLSQSLETIVDAAVLLRDLPDLVIVFQGEGVMKRDLEQRVAAFGLDNVRFLPYAQRDQLAESFASADVFVVSLQRGLSGYIVPSKLYGILAAGRPYVAAVDDACEVAVITRTHDCGRLAEPGSAQNLAEQIRAFYEDRELTAMSGANARTASLQFDRKTQVARYMSVFEAVVRESHA
jgi:glycosyltransferase involved in cell wall biosynthesis